MGNGYKMGYTDTMAKIYGEYWFNEKERYKKIRINEIPFMISEDGRLICLPKEADMPVLGICALPRTGKTWIAHAILDRIFWNWKLPIGLLNDSLDETLGWDYPNKDFKGYLTMFNEYPKPLPLVHLYPNTKTLHPLILQRKSRAIMKIAVPLSEIIQNCHLWFSLGRTQHYFRNIRKDLLEVESKEELFDLINDKIENKDMKLKLFNYLNEIFEEGIVKIKKDKEVADKIEVILPQKRENLKLKTIQYNTFSGLMRVGLVPSLHTYDLLIKQYYPNFFRYLLEEIYQMQFQDNYFKTKEIFLYMDEILRISSTMNKTLASKALEKILTRTGMARIGFMYASQSYLKLDPFVQGTTRYLLTSRFNTEKEANLIAKNFDLTNTVKERILNLDKFEFMAMTNERFISYDNQGNREVEREAIVGKALPPLSRHLAPKERLV